MQRFFKVLLATILTIFSIPFGGMTALAEENVYDDIEDGEYEIGVSSSSSAAGGFLLDEAILSIKGEDITLTLGYAVQGYELNWTKLEGKDPKNEKEEEGAKYYTFKIEEIKYKYDASMEYAVPDFPQMADGHEVG